ncbi:hypothetical protein RJT34_04958 [Clitoria ternatea]|uniref:Arf-GAP domain-containing protein n=1 Tax=Clitoria ternatea TaxID=43366 RepID=A0AAN9Q345_CLITE
MPFSRSRLISNYRMRREKNELAGGDRSVKERGGDDVGRVGGHARAEFRLSLKPNFPVLLKSHFLFCCALFNLNMNGKASVSKELNVKHTKILEGLLKLPENKECADCRNNAPRWASVNLGIFICMQCSGIHRSLGVHISKVRSTTLDTWLPEQVSFMQFMGNEKSNKHWEAKMPPDFDRSKLGIEKFIRAKYVEKRWASKDELRSSSKSVEIICSFNESSDGRARSGIPKNYRRLSLEESILANHMAQILPPTARSHGGYLNTPKKNSPPLKRPSSSVDFDKSTGKSNGTTDIFNLLCIHDEKQNFSTIPPSSWEKFDCKSLYLYLCFFYKKKMDKESFENYGTESEYKPSSL